MADHSLSLTAAVAQLYAIYGEEQVETFASLDEHRVIWPKSIYPGTLAPTRNGGQSQLVSKTMPFSWATKRTWMASRTLPPSLCVLRKIGRAHV